MENKVVLNEVSVDTEGFENKYGDKNYYDVIKKLKRESLNRRLRDEDLDGLVTDGDYNTMFMTF
jgi:hypothetical protein